jgi:hypothetical protein
MPPTLQKITSTQIVASTGATAGFVLTSTGAGATPTFQAVPSTAARQETLHVSVNTGAADKATAAFSFVVGLVFIELLDSDTADANDVLFSGFVNMRSFGGTKTANITDRFALLMGQGDFACIKIPVDRTSSGTILTLRQPQGIVGGLNPNGVVGISSTLDYVWPATGRLRITAIEDTQS